MRKILPILLATIVYLTPLYPIYAQSTSTQRIARPTAASAAAKLDAAKQKLENKTPALTDKMQATRDKVATRAAALQAKLARFRDKAKATRVETINSNLASINSKRTSQMQQSLDRLQAVVAKLKTWAAAQKAAGKDVTDIEKAIADTQAAWTEADTALKAQLEKDYTIVVNTESTVKTDAKTARDNLHNDLKMLHDKVVDIRQTLSSALASWKGAK